jgi:hypothetical protein
MILSSIDNIFAISVCLSELNILSSNVTIDKGFLEFSTLFAKSIPFKFKRITIN